MFPRKTLQGPECVQFNIGTRQFRQNLNRYRTCMIRRRRERLSGASGPRIFFSALFRQRGEGDR